MRWKRVNTKEKIEILSSNKIVGIRRTLKNFLKLFLIKLNLFPLNLLYLVMILLKNKISFFQKISIKNFEFQRTQEFFIKFFFRNFHSKFFQQMKKIFVAKFFQFLL